MSEREMPSTPPQSKMSLLNVMSPISPPHSTMPCSSPVAICSAYQAEYTCVNL